MRGQLSTKTSTFAPRLRRGPTDWEAPVGADPHCMCRLRREAASRQDTKARAGGYNRDHVTVTLSIKPRGKVPCWITWLSCRTGPKPLCLSTHSLQLQETHILMLGTRTEQRQAEFLLGPGELFPRSVTLNSKSPKRTKLSAGLLSCFQERRATLSKDIEMFLWRKRTFSTGMWPATEPQRIC